ncbi:hypothetical protein KR032_004637, partial [Drosophila birchii]
NDNNLIEGPTGSAGPSVAKPLEFGIQFSDGTAEDEDEWSDYTEENRFNYTSAPRNTWKTLSGTLLAPSTEVKDMEPEQRESAGDGLDVGHGKRLEEGPGSASCPWQNMEKTEPQQEPKEQNEPTKEPKSEQQPEIKNPSKNPTQNPETKPQVYIPPALRQSQGDCRQRPQVEKGPRKLPSAISMGKPQAPDIKSSEYFPSLGGSKSLKRPK